MCLLQTSDTPHLTGEGDDQQDGEGLLSQFIEYIKARKTVPLEQLATEFKLRTTDVIDRVHGLEAMGHLTGVMDERGKVSWGGEGRWLRRGKGEVSQVGWRGRAQPTQHRPTHLLAYGGLHANDHMILCCIN